MTLNDVSLTFVAVMISSANNLCGSSSINDTEVLITVEIPHSETNSP